MRKPIFVSLSLVLAIILQWTVQASAHVFFTDTTREVGVVMHVLPDDDPIAGVNTDIFIELQDEEISTATHAFQMSIIDEAGIAMYAPVYVLRNTSLHAVYTFPYQGSYTLKLVADPLVNDGSSQVVFEYTQRVTRGLVASPLDQPRYAWAELGLVLGACAMILLIITVIYRRKIIAGFTKW